MLPRAAQSSLLSICSRCLLKRQSLSPVGTPYRLGNAIRRATTSSTVSASQVTPSAPDALHDNRTLREIFDNGPFWLQFSNHTRDPSARRTGLFRNKYLTSPAGFKTYTTRTLKKAQRMVDSIVNASTEEELVKVVQNLDLLSDFLCRVIDLCDFVRATHPDHMIAMAATESYTEMYEYMNVLNTTTGLYDSLKRAMNDPSISKHWSQEERAVAKILYQDFDKSGINLPLAARQRFVELSGEIAELGTNFVNGAQPETEHLEFPSSRLRGMDPVAVRELTHFGSVTLPTVGMPIVHALRTVEDADVRHELYIANHTSSRKSISILEKLLRRRAELAKLTGRTCYAELALTNKMAGTPHAVSEFLTALSAANLPSAQSELSVLSTLKRQTTKHPEPLRPWDKDYYATKLFHSIRPRSKSSYVLSSFFSLGTVMQGLSRLFSRLYGLRFVPVEPAPGETWHHDVRRLDVMSDVSGRVAVVYCDLFSRPGKHSNPSHFTIRCSRRVASESQLWPDEDPTDGMASSMSSPTQAAYQLPTIALICDFSSPLTSLPTSPAVLSFRELQTLFHEMGHALHSILGRTDLHNIAGTRCATDFAELPSILMEYFASDEAVLGLFARHWRTDEPLPFSLVREAMKRDELFQATETRQQIILAWLDQELHSLPIETSPDSSRIWREVNKRWGLWGEVSAEEPTWQGFFGHLYGYGATYYAYLFDRAIAAEVWRKVFKGRALERERGERYKKEVLGWGGKRSGWECVAGVLGRAELAEGGEGAMREVGNWGRELK